MAQALYRQYRSKRFSEVIGQEHITDLLANALEQGAISHAYLFTGPRGVGKTSVARILAHEINQLPYSDRTHLDIIEVDAASNRRIDDIRDLREKVHIAPTSAKFKVYIIDEVHMLTGESFNALLKTLEEPPAHVVFILATTELHKVPATIVSRTQRYTFRPVAKDKVIAHLAAIAKQEGVAIADDALALIAEHGEGSFRDSISLLDQLSSLKQHEITPEMVEGLLGLAPHQQVDRIITAIIAHDQPGAVAVLQDLLDNGSSAQTITDQLLRSLPERAHESPALYDLITALLDVPRSYAPGLKLLATVAHAARKPTAQRSMPLSTPSAAVISAPIIKPPKQPVTIDTPAIKPAPETVEEPHPTYTPAPAGSGGTDFDWALVMAQLQKRAAPLHSVLNRATVSHEGNTLTLEFAYNLHRKKLEDGKYRAQLSALINDLFGFVPDIQVTLKDASTPPSDPTAAAVAAIMGGGVEVNA